MTVKKKVFSQAQVRAAIERLTRRFLKEVPEPRSTWTFVGIQRRGVPLAKRLVQIFQELEGTVLPLGILDITFYRDDVEERALQPVVHDTELPFDVNDKTVFLVDDVLFTGRTARCALDELMDFGRPRRVYLVVLVDRGHRELPIAASFVGETLSTRYGETVEVHLEEVDGEDAVWVTPSQKTVEREETVRSHPGRNARTGK